MAIQAVRFLQASRLAWRCFCYSHWSDIGAQTVQGADSLAPWEGSPAWLHLGPQAGGRELLQLGLGWGRLRLAGVLGGNMDLPVVDVLGRKEPCTAIAPCTEAGSRAAWLVCGSLQGRRWPPSLGSLQ